MKKLLNFSIIFLFNLKTIILFLLPYFFLAVITKFKLYSPIYLLLFNVATIFIIVLFIRQMVWAWKLADKNKLTFLLR